ncbi:hypothetical protein TWF718_008250 [Orbilia javanica]|uniref:Uncharacterized protein n=1 Tax=Orbilia javanica TaxID=47235 RepID=A0AAN8RMS5_9PEZI
MAEPLLERLRNDGVIPDVIDDFTPSALIQAEFPSGKEIQLGNTLKVAATQDQPRVILTPVDAPSESEDTKYTLCLTEFCHWLVTDVQQPTSGPLDLKNAKELMEYMGPAPPAKTGKHRYVLLLFKNGKLEPQRLDGRKKWGFEDCEPRVGASHYAKQYDLELVGE